MEIMTVVCVVVSTFLGAFGSYCFSLSAKKIKKMTFSEIFFVLLSKSTILGFTLFVSSSLFYIWALSRSKLTLLYPLTALSYVWAAFIGHYLAGEKVDKWRWISIICIFLGIVGLLTEMKG